MKCVPIRKHHDAHTQTSSFATQNANTYSRLNTRSCVRLPQTVRQLLLRRSRLFQERLIRRTGKPTTRLRRTRNHNSRHLLYELCKNIPEPEKRKGRSRPQLPLSDMIFSSTYKIYSTVSGRRFATDLREAKQRGYLSHLPHYNSVFNYLESEALTPYLNELITLSAAPLKSIESDFAVDSSGFSTGQFMRWPDVKYGHERRPSAMAQATLDGRRQNEHRDLSRSERRLCT